MKEYLINLCLLATSGNYTNVCNPTMTAVYESNNIGTTIEQQQRYYEKKGYELVEDLKFKQEFGALIVIADHVKRNDYRVPIYGNHVLAGYCSNKYGIDLRWDF